MWKEPKQRQQQQFAQQQIPLLLRRLRSSQGSCCPYRILQPWCNVSKAQNEALTTKCFCWMWLCYRLAASIACRAVIHLQSHLRDIQHLNALTVIYLLTEITYPWKRDLEMSHMVLRNSKGWSQGCEQQLQTTPQGTTSPVRLPLFRNSQISFAMVPIKPLLNVKSILTENQKMNQHEPVSQVFIQSKRARAHSHLRRGDFQGLTELCLSNDCRQDEA